MLGKDNVVYYVILEMMKGDSGMFEVIYDGLIVIKNLIFMVCFGVEMVVDFVK